jgi:REP element-mobilizing transposase RayT
MADKPQYNSDRHHRRSLRLKGYDYSQSGAYFITICARSKDPLFGEIIDGEMILNDYGLVVKKCWLGIPDHFLDANLDLFVIMPNHVHGIIVLHNGRGTACRAPTERFGKPVAMSLPTIIRSFKSAVTKRSSESCNVSSHRIWQRNYYEHVIRNDDELDGIREYIANNPANWENDENNPLIIEKMKTTTKRST